MKTMQLATDFENEKKKELEHKKQLIYKRKYFQEKMNS